MSQPQTPQEIFQLWRESMEKGVETWTQMLGAGQRPDIYQFWRPFFDQSMEAWAKLQSQGPSPETLQQWKKFLDQWIEAWSRVLAQAMGSDNFAAALGKYLDQYLSAVGPVRKQMAEVGEEYLRAMNIPSRRQVTDLAEMLIALESRIEELEAKIDALAGGVAAIQAAVAGGQPVGA